VKQAVVQGAFYEPRWQEQEMCSLGAPSCCVRSLSDAPLVVNSLKAEGCQIRGSAPLRRK
jgi:hypothetical protein